MHPIIATHMSMGTVKRLSYILKYLLDFKNNLINIGCTTLYHLSMTYITVNLFIICQLIVTVVFLPRS